MRAEWKLVTLLVAILMLSSVAPLASSGGGPGAGEDRQGDGPLGDEDAMVEYAILTSADFVTEFQRLADWKTEKGVYAKVYDTTWAKNSYPGRNPMAQYHAFLRDLYAHTDGGLEYLLIGGDHEVVRSQEIWTGVKPDWSESGEWLYSDVYYSGLDRDWDLNGNGRYGEVLDASDLWEPDWDPEIAVGRATVSDLGEARDVVDKLLAYERAPDVGDWMRRAYLVSSVFNPPNSNQTTDPGNPGHWYKSFEDNSWQSIQRTLPSIPDHMDVEILYDYNRMEGGNYTPENDTLNNVTYFNAMDSGSSIFVSVTHGFITSGNGIPHYDGDGIGYNWSRAFYYDDIERLTNANMTPFIYFSSCYVGNFSEVDDTNFERLFTMRNGGAIGLVAPTELTYRGEDLQGHSEGNWWMSETFWRNMLVEGMRPGDALYEMKREYVPHVNGTGGTASHPYFQQNLAAYNLVGDPELPVWVDRPRSLTVGLPEEIYDLEYDVEVRVSEGAIPLGGARVCFQGEDFYAFADTDAEGKAVLSISPTEVGQSVKVTVTRPGYFPIRTTMDVAPAPAELMVVSQTIKAAKPRPQAGVPTVLSAEVRNIGHSDAQSFKVQFYDGDPSVDGHQAIGSPVDVPGLPAGTGHFVQSSWAAPTAGVHDIYLVADVDDEVDEVVEDNNVGSGLVTVSAMNARAASISIVDTVVGGTISLPFGNEADIAVVVESAGSAALPGVPVRLYLGDPAAGGVPIGADRFTSPMPAGSEDTVVFTYLPAQTGIYRLFAIVDPDDVVHEFDESDNGIDMEVMVGHPPSWGFLPPVQMVEDHTKLIDLVAYLTDSDTPISELNVSVYSVSTNRVTVTMNGLLLEIVPDRNWYGYFEVDLVADDGDFMSHAGFNVTVESRNDPPVFNDTQWLFGLSEGVRWYYVFDIYDPDGDPVFVSDNSDLFDVTVEGVIDFTPSFDDIRLSPVHVFRAVATDGVAQSYYPMTLEFEHNNTPPQLLLPERLYAVEGARFSYQVQALDREGDSLTYSDDTDLFDIIPDTGQIVFTPTNANVGKPKVTITVSDGEHEVNATIELYIYNESPTKRDMGNLGYVILAAEVALVLVGALYILNLRRRNRKERAGKDEVDDTENA